jgi:uncharacterized membrane protein
VRRRRVDVEAVIGYILTSGVLVSLGLVGSGLVWHWMATGTLQLDYTLPGTSVADFIMADVRQSSVAAARPRLLVNWGIAVLMLTPYVRVLASFLYFVVDRDWKYSCFTAFVLGTLTYSLFA